MSDTLRDVGELAMTAIAAYMTVRAAVFWMDEFHEQLIDTLTPDTAHGMISPPPQMPGGANQSVKLDGDDTV